MKYGEILSINEALANAQRIAGAVHLPVTVDFEGGYAVDPDSVAANLTRLAATGTIGCNIEDQVVGGDGLHAVEATATRIAAAPEAVGAERNGVVYGKGVYGRVEPGGRRTNKKK